MKYKSNALKIMLYIVSPIVIPLLWINDTVLALYNHYKNDRKYGHYIDEDDLI